MRPYPGTGSHDPRHDRSRLPGPDDGVCTSANQEEGGEKLPGVLELELFRRHQALAPMVPRDDIDSIPRIFGSERRSVKAW